MREVDANVLAPEASEHLRPCFFTVLDDCLISVADGHFLEGGRGPRMIWTHPSGAGNHPARHCASLHKEKRTPQPASTREQRRFERNGLWYLIYVVSSLTPSLTTSSLSKKPVCAFNPPPSAFRLWGLARWGHDHSSTGRLSRHRQGPSTDALTRVAESGVTPKGLGSARQARLATGLCLTAQKASCECCF